MTILERILETKRREVDELCRREAPEVLARRARTLARPVRGFAEAIRSGPRPRVIAEIKHRSPSRGVIRPDFDPVACAKAYADGGAVALSVLTDAEFFGGELAFLERVRAVVDLPLLRKDFLIDPAQVDEARLAGADAVLLIAAALEGPQLRGLRERAETLGLDALVEVHDEQELAAALETGATVIGINNRDLRTFEVDLGVTERLASRIPPGVVLVAESGIFRYDDVQRLEAAGAHAVLVGEALMREADLGLALRTLRGRT